MRQVLFIIILISYLFSSSFDSHDGAPIRQGVHVEWYRTVAPGEQGEVIFVWSDTRFGMRNIFAHKVNQNGLLLWGESGAIITDLPGRQEDPVAITDGSGGAYIAWVDYRFDAEGDIFLQHINSDGEILLDSNGVALAQVSGKQITINMCTDSLGGVFITWQDKRGGVDDDIYGTHVNNQHEIVSPRTGVPVVVEGGNQNAKTIEYAGNNEAFIAWADFREGANADIYGQRLDVTMSGLFQDNGFPIAYTEDQELKPRATFVDNTTSFVAWKKGDENSRILYQFIDEDGLVFTDPKAISDNEALQTAPRVKRNYMGEVFVNWKDLRDDPINGDQYFQKINVDGDPLWDDGVKMDPAEDIDFSARFAGEDSGGLSVVWERGTFPDVDILYQHINADGTYGLEEPIFISSETGYQFAPILSGNIQDGLFAIYGDRGAGSIDLKVQKIGLNYSPEWENNGLIAMDGLDGDVSYTHSYRISDGDIYYIWEDNRASKKIYGSRLTDLEIAEVDGKQLTFSDNSSSETDFSTPVILKTDNGIYTATFDGSSSPKFIRINKMDENLNNVWDSSGVSLSAVFDMRNALLFETADGVGSVWSESRGFNYNIYYQKLDINGDITLENEGVEIVDSNGDDYIMAVVPSPIDEGKFMIFWMEDAWPAASLKFSKMDAEGNIEIGWNPNGNSLSNASYDSRHLQVKPYGEDEGLLLVWIQDGNFSDIYVQAIDWEGNILWQDGGIPIVSADNDQVNVSFEFNEPNNNVLFAWEDYRNGSDFEIYADVLDMADGTLLGETLQFSNDTTDQYNPVIQLIQDNEFLILWEDERGYYNSDPLLINGVDLYGTGYIIGQGMTTDMNGIPICIAYHKQQNVNITKYMGDEYFLDWIDFRSSGKEDLANYYGKILVKADVLSSSPSCQDCYQPEEFYLIRAYPNPFNGRINFEFNIPEKHPAELKIFDLTGRVIFDSLILPGSSGIKKVSWDGINSLGQSMPSGIYLYKFIVNNNINKGKISYIK